MGIYYTPPEAAKILARWVIRSPHETVLEPSFGGCAMLSAAVSILRSLGNEHPSRQLYGYDIDAIAFEHLAQIGIENTEGHFKKQDFLRANAGELRVSSILANPPFVSYHRQDEAQRRAAEKLRQRYLPALPKVASLWAYFLLHSLSFLRPGGRMAFVLPNAIGAADYSQTLLAFLQRQFEKIELINVGERLFIQAGADERISLLLLSNYAPQGLAKPGTLLSRDILRIDEIEDHKNSTFLTQDGLGTLDARGDAYAALAAVGEDTLVPLGSAASVQIGEVVGDIGFLTQSMSAWSQQGITPNHLRPLLTRSAQVRGIYVPTDITLDSSSRIPYLLAPSACRLPKAIERYLSQYPPHEIVSNKTFAKRNPWYRCSYDTSAHAFIGSMSHDYPRIIGNDAGISSSNAFYKITANAQRPDLIAWLPILSVTTPLRLSAEVLGRLRGSGGIKLEPSDVRRLSIPHALPKLRKAEFIIFREKIDKLIRLGELDAAGQLADSVIYLQTGLMDARAMTDLRMKRLTLTNRRLVTN
ncbi:hypothetical protein A8E95_22095 [Burkholderia cenocepacia]|nr:N-6 DNA methylase [Burkholderia cenocepacia]AQQ36080.1 hypothetical protein A8E96_28940 [Burkholderia cenocepacia]ONW30250.1 hypothetical protein A8E95_22095 [Burkholderia cenocepacia]